MNGEAQAEAYILHTFKEYCASRGVVWQSVRPATVELFALGQIASSEPLPRPRSWPKELEGLFAVLPRSLQEYLIGRDAQIGNEVRRCQSRAAEAERKLKEIS